MRVRGGHHIHLDAPEVVLDAIRRLLGRGSRGSP